MSRRFIRLGEVGYVNIDHIIKVQDFKKETGENCIAIFTTKNATVSDNRRNVWRIDICDDFANPGLTAAKLVEMMEKQ